MRLANCAHIANFCVVNFGAGHVRACENFTGRKKN